MHILKKMVLGSVFLTLAASKAVAQDSSGLQLKDALYYALSHYAEAKKARLDLENANYQIDEVRSRALPQVSGSGGLNYNPLLQMSALPGELNPTNPGQTMLIAFGQKWNANLGVSLTQNLFDQSVFTGLKAAKSTREFYQLNSQLTEEKVMEQVATAYYQVWVQQQQIANVDSNIRTAEQVRLVIMGQFENGLGKKIDVDRLDVKLINLNSQRMQLLNALALYENQLKFFIGMPISEPLKVANRTTLENGVTLADLADPLLTDSRTEMKVLRKQEELLNYKKQSVMAEYYPTLSLSANYSYQGLSNSFPIFKGMDKGANWFDVSTIGLNLKVPIFNGKATRSRLNQADVELKKLKQDQVLATQNLNLEYENARTQIRNALIFLNNQQKNIELAQKVLDNTRNNYREGLAPLTDLLDAQNALYDAQNAYNVSQLDLRVAEIKLLKAKGELNKLVQ